MITIITNGKKVGLAKPKIVGTLAGEDAAKIRSTLEALLTVDELKKIQGFQEDCQYLKENCENSARDENYFETRDRVLRAVRNHGIPRKGHLDDYAKKLIAKYRGAYRSLLDDASVAESFGVVLAHYGEGEHNPRYEAHLNHLNEVINTRNPMQTRAKKYGLAKLI